MDLVKSVIEEMINGVANNMVSPYAATMAILGSVGEMVNDQEKTIHEKDEQIRGYKSALKLADEEKKRAKTFREKPCRVCGKIFTPKSAAQTICETCKDIKQTAKELADGKSK
jgi:hypothetical protein